MSWFGIKLFVGLAWALIAAVYSDAYLADENDVTVDLQHSVCQVSEHFLSVTIDAGSIRNKEWETIDFTSTRMQNLARALTPAMLRVGGTAQDFLYFQDNVEVQSTTGDPEFPDVTDTPSLQANFTLTAKDWDTINSFVSSAGWEFIFGLNALTRAKTDSPWDSGNAKKLMEYTLSKGYNVSWELGNGKLFTEPDLFDRNGNITVSPEQLAKDFGTLKDLIAQVKLHPKFIAGPDVATLTHLDFFREFLMSMKPGVLNAITWHQYYTNGATAVLPDMFSVEMLDKLISGALSARESVDKYLPGTELWLGETSSCYDGGAPVLSDSYVAGFMWLDKLGIAALTNHSRVFRQDFIGGSYSLLDSHLNPLPDYWLSVLHKKLVGATVLNVSNGIESGRHVRVYAHCARQPLYSAGDVTLLILNIHTFDTTATLKTSSLVNAHRDVYWLTPPGTPGNVLSKQVTLNGKLLALVDNTTVPDLVPDKQEPSDTINLPALTFGFYVFKDVKAIACM